MCQLHVVWFNVIWQQFFSKTLLITIYTKGLVDSKTSNAVFLFLEGLMIHLHISTLTALMVGDFCQRSSAWICFIHRQYLLGRFFL